MAGELGEASVARKLSTATSILARTCRQQAGQSPRQRPQNFRLDRRRTKERARRRERGADLSRREDVRGAEAAVGAEERRRRHVRLRRRHR